MTTVHTGQISLTTTPEKLVSWKSIAKYFECDERTAKRWERERALPVHRAPGGKRSGVFAYVSELDSWLNNGMRTGRPATRADEHNPAKIRPDSSTALAGLAGTIAMAGETVLPARTGRQRIIHQSLIWTATGVAALFLAAASVFLTHKDRRDHAPVLTASEASSAGLHHAPAADAEDLYLQGRYFWNLRSAASLSKATSLYMQAIAKDPSYAEAYAGLAETYDLLPQFGQADLGDSLRKAEEAANHAIALNPNLVAAHRALAFARFYWDWDISGSDAEFRRALALDPNSAETHQWYASTLENRLEGAECLQQINEALRLNPASPAIAVDAALMAEEFGADSSQGIRRLRELEQTQPLLSMPSSFLRQIYFAEGDYPAYIAELHRIASITRQPFDVDMARAATRGWSRAAKSGMLEEIAAVQKAAFERGTEPGFWLGQTYLLLGRPKEALPYFRASLAKHFILLITMEDCTWAKRLDTDPDYADLYAKIRQRTQGQVAHPSVIPGSFRLPN
jgi:tetratricopeptide (TPR) repeat protein